MRKPFYTDTVIPPAIESAHHITMDYLADLKALRKRRGLSQAKLAELVGVEQPTVQRWEKGTRLPDLDSLTALAKALGVSPGSLLDGTVEVSLGPQLFVIGEVAAGVFKSAWQNDREDWEPFVGRPDLVSPTHERFGLKVVGDSMNLLYPEGTILECCYYHGRDIIPSGKRVIVQRVRTDGRVEATVKELHRDELGKEWLVPRSSNPLHRSFRGDRPDEADIERVEIIAIVVASTRVE